MQDTVILRRVSEAPAQLCILNLDLAVEELEQKDVRKANEGQPPVVNEMGQAGSSLC